MKILIIKTGNTIDTLRARGEDFEDWFIQRSGIDSSQFVACSLHQGEDLPDLKTIDGIIITGSPAFITDEEDWNFLGADYIRRAYQQQIPILGICYGHQLIAWAFGGEAGFHPRGREIGTVAIELTEAGKEDPLLGGLPETFPAQVSHLQSVLRLPEGAVRLASNEFDPNHGYRLGENCWSLQFHPEFSAEVMTAYINERQEDIAAEGLDPKALREQVAEAPDSESIIATFVRLVVSLS